MLTIALKPAPILRKEARNKISPTATPIIPLIIKTKYSSSLNAGETSPFKTMNDRNPITPTIFFNKLICKLLKTLPAIPKNITPQDQHSAVKIA